MSSVVLAVFQCWYPHTFIMQPTAPLQKTADKATSKNFLFSRKQQKIYSYIFYHLCITVTIFQETKPLSIFQQEYFLWHNTKNNRVNNKLKYYTSYCYFIFSIIFKSTLLYPISQNALRSWWQQLLGKIWVFQCQNAAMAHISRKTKS